MRRPPKVATLNGDSFMTTEDNHVLTGVLENAMDFTFVKGTANPLLTGDGPVGTAGQL